MSAREDVIRLLMRAHPQIQVEMPVNVCPDDDPPGERPAEMVWATDLTATVDDVMAWLAQHDAEVRAKQQDIDARIAHRLHRGRVHGIVDFAYHGNVSEAIRGQERESVGPEK